MGVMILFSVFMNILGCSVKTQLARLLKTLFNSSKADGSTGSLEGSLDRANRAVSVQAGHVGPGTDSDPYRMTKHY